MSIFRRLAKFVGGVFGLSSSDDDEHIEELQQIDAIEAESASIEVEAEREEAYWGIEQSPSMQEEDEPHFVDEEIELDAREVAQSWQDLGEDLSSLANELEQEALEAERQAQAELDEALVLAQETAALRAMLDDFTPELFDELAQPLMNRALELVETNQHTIAISVFESLDRWEKYVKLERAHPDFDVQLDIDIIEETTSIYGEVENPFPQADRVAGVYEHKSDAIGWVEEIGVPAFYLYHDRDGMWWVIDRGTP